MQGWLTLIATVTVLLFSITGQQVARLASHTHLLIGSVTPEQLRTHEDEEARAGQPLVVTFSSDKVATIHGGIIVSLLGSLDESRLPVVLNGTLTAASVFVSVICCSVLLPRPLEHSLVYPPLDPPPRFIFEFA
jgi:hypothetical protein